MNQVIQRIGRVVRVYQGKRKALIYVVYISETKDDGILQIFRKAIELGGRTAVSEESVADEVGQTQTNKEVEE
jgi:superfamily II DNA or RNA helicase